MREIDETTVDGALIDAARMGLLAELVGLPLLPWQQRYLDRMYVREAAVKSGESE